MVDGWGEGFTVGVGEVDGGTVGGPDGVGVVVGDGFDVCGCWFSTYQDTPRNTTTVNTTAIYKILANYLELPIQILKERIS